MSVGWPRGIEILLEHGADVNVADESGLPPVEYAVARPCAESLRLFDEADCALHQSLRHAIQFQRFLPDGSGNPRADFTGFVIEIEANRRRKLQSLLSLSLPERVLRSLSLLEDRILDQQLPAAMAALERHNISVPPSLKLNQDSGTVYHYEYLTLRILNSLWEAGFRDVNGLDEMVQTPLMAMDYEHLRAEETLEMIAWFEKKGVDIHQKVHLLHQDSEFESGCRFGCSCRKSGHTVLHYVSHRLAYSKIGWEDYSTLSSVSQAHLRLIIGNEIQDDCKCACSSGGCRALCMLLKPIFSRRTIAHHDQMLSRFIVRCLSSSIVPDRTTSDLVLSDLVRLLTFERLNLTHTCCRERGYWVLLSLPFEDDEIQEIQNEEHEDLQLLENLMVEFDQRRRELGYPLAQFMKEYWMPRMEEVLSEQKPIDYEKVREIGVVLHDSDVKSEDEDGSEDEEGEGDEDEDDNDDEIEDKDDDKKEDDRDEGEDEDGREEVKTCRNEERT